MSDKITIQYEAVYNQSAAHCAELGTEVADLIAEYAQLHQDAQTMDGRANADYHGVLAVNRKKGEITCELLQRLLQFIELSSRQVEEDEMILKASYTLGQTAIGGVQ